MQQQYRVMNYATADRIKKCYVMPNVFLLSESSRDQQKDFLKFVLLDRLHITSYLSLSDFTVNFRSLESARLSKGGNAYPECSAKP